jgi:hypothetical protein
MIETTNFTYPRLRKIVEDLAKSGYKTTYENTKILINVLYLFIANTLETTIYRILRFFLFFFFYPSTPVTFGDGNLSKSLHFFIFYFLNLFGEISPV